eukprot:gene8116-10991_t
MGFILGSKDYLTDLSYLGLLKTRNINITTEDGIIIKGYHTLNPSHKTNDYNFELANCERIILYLHGNAGNRALPTFRVDKFIKLSSYLNAHVITIDYRGFGDSQGSPSEYGTLLDTKAVIKWIHDIVLLNNDISFGYFQSKHEYQKKIKSYLNTLNNNNNNNNTKNNINNNINNSTMSRKQPYLYIYGSSLGGGIAAAIAEELSKNYAKSLTGLILESTFTSMPEAALSHPVAAPFRIFPFIRNIMFNYLSFKYPTLHRIPNIEYPLLFMHGLKDDKIPIIHAKRNYNAALNRTYSNDHIHLHNNNYNDVNNNDSNNNHNNNNNNCSARKYYTELIEFPDANHDTIYLSLNWIDRLTEFMKKSEIIYDQNNI